MFIETKKYTVQNYSALIIFFYSNSILSSLTLLLLFCSCWQPASSSLHYEASFTRRSCWPNSLHSFFVSKPARRREGLRLSNIIICSRWIVILSENDPLSQGQTQSRSVSLHILCETYYPYKNVANIHRSNILF